METKTIEERANEVTSRFSYRYGYLKSKDAYIDGATYMVNRAVEWLEDNMQTNYENVCVAESKEFETHTEFIKRFEQAMKGE